MRMRRVATKKKIEGGFRYSTELTARGVCVCVCVSVCVYPTYRADILRPVGTAEDETVAAPAPQAHWRLWSFTSTHALSDTRGCTRVSHSLCTHMYMHACTCMLTYTYTRIHDISFTAHIYHHTCVCEYIYIYIQKKYRDTLSHLPPQLCVCMHSSRRGGCWGLGFRV
jgi:hypothetical protein